MVTPSIVEIEQLITELHTKDLLPDDAAEKLRRRLETEDALVRISLLGRLHAWRDDNRLTAEDAERYIRKLGIPKEEEDRHLARTRAEQTKRRNMN